MWLLERARQEAERNGDDFPHHGHDEMMWMLHQHQPHHPLLKGSNCPPPPATIPQVLQRLGLLAGQQQEQLQCLPHAFSPNMLPSSMAQAGTLATRQAAAGMSFHPELANASAAMNAQVLGSSGQMSMPLSARTPRMRSPSSGSPTAPTTRYPPALSLTSQSQLQTGASLGPLSAQLAAPGPRAPSFTAPYSFAVRSPSRPSPIKISQIAAARPPTPGYSPSPAPTLPATLPAKRMSFAAYGPTGPTGPTGSMLPRPAGAFSKVDLPHPDNGAPVPHVQEPTHMSTLDIRVAQHLAKLEPDRIEAVIIRLRKHPDQKASFVAQMDAKDKEMDGLMLQQRLPHAVSVTSQRVSTKQPAEPTSRKRKQPSTAVEKLPAGREVIDLTDDLPPQRKVLAATTDQPRTKRPRIGRADNNKLQGKQPSFLPMIPESRTLPSIGLVDQALLHTQAVIHGVRMSDVEFSKNVHLGDMDWVQERKDARTATCLLNPSDTESRRMARVNAKAARPTYAPEPTIAVAADKVKSGNFDFTFSGNIFTEPPPPSTETLLETGCTITEHGMFRAPEEAVMSEERAQLEWDLLQILKMSCPS
jgi:hypothetical protein